MDPRSDDKEFIVDTEKFRLVPYVKFLVDPRTVKYKRDLRDRG
jgi:hypothetical protein